MKDLCRTCGEIPLNLDVKNLFKNKALVAFIRDLTGMQIKNEKKLSVNICSLCEKKLNEMISFRKRCILVQNFFNFKIWKELKSKELEPKVVTHPDPLTSAEDLVSEICADELESVKSTCTELDVVIEKEISYFLENKEDKEAKDVYHLEDDCIGHDKFSSKQSLLEEKEQGEAHEYTEEEYDSMEDDNFVITDETKTAKNLFLDELFDSDELESRGRTDEESNEVITDSEQEVELGQDPSSTVDKESFQEDQNSKAFICDICGKVLRKMGSLRRHRLTHNTFKRFKCRKCTKAYHTLWDLEQHVRIHTDNHPYMCRFCSAKFTYPNAKRRHEKIHTNERPHKCTHCGKGFIASSALKQHEATHTRIKSYRCGTCGFLTSSQKQLARHLKTKIHRKNENEQNRRLQEINFEDAQNEQSRLNEQSH